VEIPRRVTGWISLLTAAFLLLVGLVQLPLAGSASAASPPSGLTWVRCGGPIGGMGYDIRMRPDNPDIMLVTDSLAGIFRSTDGGMTWQPSNTGITQRSGTSGDVIPVFSVTIDPHNNDIVWAGTQGLGGIFRSSDGGLSWAERDDGVIESEGLTFRGFTVDPRSSDIVYAAGELSSYQWNGGVEKKGKVFDLTKGVVYKTTDGGAHWKAAWRGDNLARYIWIDPDHPDTVYVSTGIFDREAANSDPSISRPTGGEGVIKSTDGGLTWSHVNNGLGKNLYVGSLFMSPRDPQTLLAAVGEDLYHEADHGGVYLSTDGAASWQCVLDAEVMTSVEFAVADPRVAYAASFQSVFRSEDGGRSWKRMGFPDRPWGPSRTVGGFPIDIQVDPRNPNRLFINSYLGGNFLSEDGGASWSIASKGYTGAQTRDICVDASEPGRVIAVGRSGIFGSLNGGMDWEALGSARTGDVEFNAVAVDPEDGQHLLAANNQFGQLQESRDGGRTWSQRASGLLGSGNVLLSFRSLAFAPSDRSMVYAGTGAFFSAGSLADILPAKGLYVSHDGGKTWSAANDDLSSSVQVADLAVHPADTPTVYAAALGDGLLRTSNGGKNWTRLAGPWGAGTVVLAVAIQPSDPRMVFAATDAGLFVTSDAGSTWQRLTTGLPPEARYTSIIIDPTDPRVLYVSDQRSGVYRSSDGGAFWAVVNDGLRTKAVNRLAISSDGRHLYAATEGEGVFRLDLNGAAPPTVVERVTFSDVATGHPYYTQIIAVAGQGIVGGFADGTFRPDAAVTRQQFAKMIVKALGLSIWGDEACPFTDVGKNLDANDPYYPDKYVSVCAEAGITTGTSPTTFNPTGNVTRAQLITMVTRAANLLEPPVDYVPPFGDFSSIHYPWARRAAYAGLLDGLQGMGPGFAFLAPATRGEVCVLLYGLLR
jgi:photosystem II stability/assembly factor-like uncharacterized protein